VKCPIDDACFAALQSPYLPYKVDNLINVHPLDDAVGPDLFIKRFTQFF
jgi:hypothetical protein